MTIFFMMQQPKVCIMLSVLQSNRIFAQNDDFSLAKK